MLALRMIIAVYDFDDGMVIMRTINNNLCWLYLLYQYLDQSGLDSFKFCPE